MCRFFSVVIFFISFYASSLESSEEFLGKKPQCVHVFTTRLELGERWARNPDSTNLREEWSYEGVHSLLKVMNFKPFYCGHPTEIVPADKKIDGSDHVLGKLDKAHRLKEVIIHESVYNPGSLELSLFPRACPRNAIFIADEKSEPVCSPLSWKWVGYALEYIMEAESGCNPKRADLLEKVPARIERHGLIRAITRIATVTNAEGVCAFYAIYDTGEERETSVRILEKLKVYVAMKA